MGRRPGSKTGEQRRAIGVRVRPATFAWLGETAAERERPLSTQASVLLEAIHDDYIRRGLAAPVPAGG